MRLFQSEKRLSKELTRILSKPQNEGSRNAENKALAEEHDFIVYLPTDLLVDFNCFDHFKIRDGQEILAQF